MNKARKLLLSLLVVGAVGGVVAVGSFSAFFSQTTNPGNSFAAGTVQIADNDAGAALYTLTNQKPGVTTTKCIRVNYTGSLDADVKIYTTDAINANIGPYVNVVITPGTQASPSFPDCTGFTPDAGGAIFNNTLANFASTHNSYATGLVDNPGATTKWVTSDAVIYRFEISLADNNSANNPSGAGYASGTHAFTWEARNQ